LGLCCKAQQVGFVDLFDQNLHSVSVLLMKDERYQIGSISV